MKNLKKLISVIIAVIMLVSSFATVAAADYADVESTNSYAKAIQVLSGLGIAKGDEAGNFNPTNDVKRSEMVAFVCRMMGEENIATASSTNAFTDVAANHWAAGYIAWGVNNGIVNGMGDGTFAPDASVTYQDAVVMIMRALGYDRIAKRAENGGYPTGYLKVASQNNVLTNAGYDNAKAATREIIAQLIYNGLTAPIVAVSEYGATVEEDKYTIYNGKGRDGELRTILTYTNEVDKVKVEIAATPKSEPATCIDKNGDYLVGIDLTNATGYDYGDAKVTDVANKIGASAITNIGYVYAGETDAANLLGYTVEAYIAYDEDLDAYKLLAVVADTKSVASETVAIDFEDVAALEDGVYVATYYKNINDRKPAEIEIAESFTVYVNGAKDASIDTYGELKTAILAADEVTFVGGKNDPYNKIFITDYVYAVVDSVNVDAKLIKYTTTPRRGTLDLDAESRGLETFIYNIYDANGNAMDIADIEAGDVLNIVAPADELDNATPYVDIYVTNEVVEGKVKEAKTSGEYVINDKEYMPEGVSLSIGEEGLFYLTIDGKVIKKEAASTVTKNFLFLLGVEEEVEFSKPSFTLRVFTAEGIKDLKVAETLKYYDGTVTGDADNYLTYKAEDYANLISTLFNVTSSEDGDNVPGTITALLANDTEANAKANVNKRFFSYKTDANGNIVELRNFTTASNAIAASALAEREYVAEYEEFGGEVVGSAAFFVIPVDGTDAGSDWNIVKDKLAIGSFASLDEKDSYNTYMYTLDNDEVVAVVSVEEIGYGTEMSPLAVLKSVGTTMNDNEVEVASYTFVQGAETKTIMAAEDITGAGSLAVGDVFQYAVNADNEIAKVDLIYDYSATDLTSYAKGFDYKDDDTAFAFGIVTEYTDRLVLASDFDVDVACDAVDPEACDHESCAYYEGTGEATTFARFKFAEVEGATFAALDYNANERNRVKVITANGVKETVKENAQYAAVVRVDENGKVVEIISIALDDTAFDTYEETNAKTWKLNIVDAE